jgi:hypothetical protein
MEIGLPELNQAFEDAACDARWQCYGRRPRLGRQAGGG